MLLQFVFLAIFEDAIVSIGPWIQVVTSISLLQHGVHSVLSCLYRQGRRKPMLRRCRDHSRWSGCSEDQKDGHFSESIPFCLECDGFPMRSGWKGICCGSYSVWPLVLFLSPNHTSDSWHSKFEFTVEIPQSTLVSSISQRISCSHILLLNLVIISSPGPAMACLACLAAWPDPGAATQSHGGSAKASELTWTDFWSWHLSGPVRFCPTVFGQALHKRSLDTRSSAGQVPLKQCSCTTARERSSDLMLQSREYVTVQCGNGLKRFCPCQRVHGLYTRL